MMDREAFGAWKGRPETAEFLEFIAEVREDLKERWASGELLDDKDHAIAIVYGDILALDYDRDVKAFYERKYGPQEAEDEDGEQGGYPPA